MCHRHRDDVERLHCRFHHIAGTELIDSKKSSRSIALEIKESIDTPLPLAGDAVERVCFGLIDTAFCAKIRLCRRYTREIICIKAVVYVVCIVPDFIVFIGKKRSGGGWFGLKSKLLYSSLSTALRNHKTIRTRALRDLYSLLT